MRALTRLAGFGALLSLAACSLAQPVNDNFANVYDFIRHQMWGN